MSFLSERNSTFQQVKDFHLNSDVDQSFIAQHHTLGPLTNQASPGDHIHDGTTSKKLSLGNLEGKSVPFTVLGGTLGTQPTFTGAPLFTGSYTKLGNLVHFQLDVDMDNITSFGTGQYFINLPFPAEHNYQVSDGCLHDFSTGDQYSVMGHVVAGASQLRLFSVASNGRHVAFTASVPVNLATADNFHLAGTYEIAQ
jgi:hypothetical protein